MSVVLFYTSNHAFRAEKLLIARDIACRLVPVPRHLSSDCGVCLSLDVSRLEEVVEILNGAKVEMAGIHAAS